ncbi:MAG TPA: hypothetical protein VGG28_19405, partial [Kofleriaceae bacterium]
MRWLLLATLVGCAQATASLTLGGDTRVDAGNNSGDDASNTPADAPVHPDASEGSGSGSGS